MGILVYPQFNEELITIITRLLELFEVKHNTSSFYENHYSLEHRECFEIRQISIQTIDGKA